MFTARSDYEHDPEMNEFFSSLIHVKFDKTKEGLCWVCVSSVFEYCVCVCVCVCVGGMVFFFFNTWSLCNV